MADELEKSMQTVDESKRETIRKLVRTAAFTAPVIATFAIDGKMNTALSGLSSASNS
ncbi:MAG: hypothetical protein AAF299_07755 [Pseudomonadota bacterium]